MVYVVGAGPAGLAAAHELIQRDCPVVVLEKSDKVGGLARTETYKGARFDIGGHRFYTKVPEIQKLWTEMLGEDFRTVRRLSRIYYQGKFFKYPISLPDALANLGFVESVRIMGSFLWAKIFPFADEKSFEHWVINRFGRRLYTIFFKTYTEKVWGISCDRIQAEWAAQRIKDLSITSAIKNALFPGNQVKSLIDEFHYPLLGPGMMWERFSQWVQSKGGQVSLNANVTKILHDESKVTAIGVKTEQGEEELPLGSLVSSMPLDELVARLEPAAPTKVRKAAAGLHYRAFILVGLVVGGKLFPDNWLYIHSPDFKVGRIQNFRNWSAEMAPGPGITNIGMEYFCHQGDDLWRAADAELIALASQELVELGLAEPQQVRDGFVIRQTKAYPVYDEYYMDNLKVIRAYLESFGNLHTIGRNGMYRYNNQDHSMLTGILAARNLAGENHDLWTVNTERSYYEEFVIDE